uniref:Major sperm protein n=1 Tax=Parascaris univalens TaxID=6257 RepID=A0A915C8X1_PARUN
MSEIATNIKLASASQSKPNYNAFASPSTATVTINKYDLYIYRAKNSSRMGSKRKDIKIEVPRAVLETRSPGSKPKVLLRQLEAIGKKEKLKGRSPGASIPPPRFRESKKLPNKETHSSARPVAKILNEGGNNNSEKAKQTDLPQFKSAILPLLPTVVQSAPLIADSSVTSSHKCQIIASKTDDTTAKSTRRSRSRVNQAKGLTVDPTEAEFSVAGGMSTLMILNESNVRFAIKIKTSNNQYFRVNPVYSFLDSGAMNELEIFRLPGGMPRVDKLLLCYVIAKEEDTNAKALFTLRANIQNVYVKLKTV